MSQVPDNADVYVLTCMYWRGIPTLLPDSIRMQCDICEAAVGVSPQGQAVLKEYGDRCVVYCIGCARVSLPDSPVFFPAGADEVIRSAFGDIQADRVKSMTGKTLREFDTESLFNPNNWSTGRTKEE